LCGKAQHSDGVWLRARRKTDSAAIASSAQILRGAIAKVVQVLAHADHLGLAGFHAEAASLALLFIDPQQPAIFLAVSDHSVIP
jgi:hypothetical protein